MASSPNVSPILRQRLYGLHGTCTFPEPQAAVDHLMAQMTVRGSQSDLPIGKWQDLL